MKRNVFCPQPVGVPLPIEPFVVVSDRGYIFLKGFRPVENSRTMLAVLRHLTMLQRVQRSIFQQNVVGSLQFSYIVKKTGNLEIFKLVTRKTECLSYLYRHL